jgi:hypothetical protein
LACANCLAFAAVSAAEKCIPSSFPPSCTPVSAVPPALVRLLAAPEEEEEEAAAVALLVMAGIAAAAAGAGTEEGAALDAATTLALTLRASVCSSDFHMGSLSKACQKS